MEQRDSHCPGVHDGETTARGTGLGCAAGKEDPVELDSSEAEAPARAAQRGGGLCKTTGAWGGCVTGGPLGLVGSLAGAARPQERNAGVQRQAQGGWKPPAEHKGKSLSEAAALGCGQRKRGPGDPRAGGRMSVGHGVTEKLPQG